MRYQIAAYKDEKSPSYLIVINKSVFEMDSRADQPNGVNIFFDQLDSVSFSGMEKVKLETLPKGVLNGIKFRLVQDFETKFNIDGFKDHVKESVLID
jgi:hypothetical protein